MALKFPLPTVTRRGTSFALVALVLVLGVAYTIYYPICCAPQPDAFETVMQEFRNTCMKSARHANGGGDLVMDDATEAKLGAYCGCVADAVQGNVEPTEIARIGQGSASDATMQLLTRIVEGCKPKLE